MEFAWASAQVAVIGSMIMEMMDALNILSPPGSWRAHPTTPLSGAVDATKRAPAEAFGLWRTACVKERDHNAIPFMIGSQMRWGFKLAGCNERNFREDKQ